MARKRRQKNRTSSVQTPRSLVDRHRLLPVESVKRDVLKPRPKPKPVDMRPVEDLRHERNQTELKTFRTSSGRVARTKTRPQGDVQKSRLHSPLFSYFQNPQRVLVCIRREDRKRVLFALRRVGKGKRVSRVHRFTEKSRIRCK